MNARNADNQTEEKKLMLCGEKVKDCVMNDEGKSIDMKWEE